MQQPGGGDAGGGEQPHKKHEWLTRKRADRGFPAALPGHLRRNLQGAYSPDGRAEGCPLAIAPNHIAEHGRDAGGGGGGGGGERPRGGVGMYDAAHCAAYPPDDAAVVCECGPRGPCRVRPTTHRPSGEGLAYCRALGAGIAVKKKTTLCDG